MFANFSYKVGAHLIALFACSCDPMGPLTSSLSYDSSHRSRSTDKQRRPIKMLEPNKPN